MTPPPPRPKLYHITHVDNLACIISQGALVSDAAVIERGGPSVGIGMSTIKQRRLQLPVRCYAGDHVGDYVPFYFCPRSIMLFVIHCANHPELTYRGGQEPIVHLVADLHGAVAWSERAGRRWAFTLSNASAAYAQFRVTLAALEEIDWAAVEARDFRDAAVKEAKQSEFLVHGCFPWTQLDVIGVKTAAVKARVDAAILAAQHRPTVEIRPEWYF